MKTTKSFKRFMTTTVLGIYILSIINPFWLSSYASSTKIVFPLKEISKLDCRYEDFSSLSSNCKRKMPILKTKDYAKYSKANGGYNDYTRTYTALWGSSYKYGWDVGYGGHIGTDIATAKGTPVYAMSDGKVIIAKNLVGLGLTVVIEHTINGKKIFSNYGHLSKLSVSKGKKISAGKKIGEVGSTGNSTGNHLHFQIDLDTPFHPYYYDYKKCPYSYYKITETGVCFDELKNNTIDPLLFIESNGKVVDNIDVKKIDKVESKEKVIEKSPVVSSKYIKKESTGSKKSGDSSNISEKNYDYTIFDRTVYVGYSTKDIREVQYIMRDLGEYKGAITGNYKDVLDSITGYQIDNKIVDNINSHGAGWFGPKTRSEIRKDYISYLKKNGERIVDKKIIVNSKVKTERISRSNLLSREEIEKMEVETFIKKYDINLKLGNISGSVKKGKSMDINLSITNSKGKGYKGNMPGSMTFVVDREKLSVFPEKLYNFTDGHRTIKLKGLKEGITTLYVKIGDVNVKSFKIRVYSDSNNVDIYPAGAKIYSGNSLVIGDNQPGVILFKDNSGKKLTNLQYSGNFRISATSNSLVCIKEGSIKNISKIFNAPCKEEDYKSYVDFDYNNSIGGLVLFDIKAKSRNTKIKIVNKYNNNVLGTKNIAITDPKGINRNYVYKNEVIELLDNGILDGIKKGYFLEDRDLTQKDALSWIENSLILMKTEAIDDDLKYKIEKNLQKIKSENHKSTQSLLRKDVLELSYKYLVFNKDINIERRYKDLKESENVIANAVFGEDTTWKDKFGEHYYRPSAKITRGEGAYLLASLLEKNKSVYLTVK